MTGARVATTRRSDQHPMRLDPGDAERGRSHAPRQAAKTTLSAAGPEADVRKKRQDGGFFPIKEEVGL
jgi:hypothetical protein